MGHTLKVDLGPKRDIEASAAVSRWGGRKGFFRINYKLCLRGPEVFKALVISQSLI